MIKPELVEKTDANGKRKYAVVFDVPVSYSHSTIFLGRKKVRHVYNMQRYMVLDENDFPVLGRFHIHQGWQDIDTFWTTDKKLALKLLKLAQNETVNPEIVSTDGWA